MVKVILDSPSKSFRSIKKLADKRQIDLSKQNCWARILALANTYTGAKFENPLTIDQNYVIDCCTDFVFNYHSELCIDELKVAFDLAVSGKLKDCDITTYYGKFTVQTLSFVLNAYSTLRKQIQAEFIKREDAAKKIKSQEEIAERKTIVDVKNDYQNLIQSYKLTGTLDEDLIKPFWGKILVEHGIINFTAAEKSEIYKEAKQIVKNEVKASLGVNDDLMIRKSIVNLLNDIENEMQNEDYEAKSKAKYSHLIVVKSIINAK
jgi:hypothetical protein